MVEWKVLCVNALGIRNKIFILISCNHFNNLIIPIFNFTQFYISRSFFI